MSVTQYIGARYVPIFADPEEWTIDRAYEPLTIVTHEGNSYTSKQAVPIGIEITNKQFWAQTGLYNAQVEAYRREVQQFDGRISDNAEAIEANAEAIEANAEAIEANAEAIEETYNLHRAAVTTFLESRAYINNDTGDDETAEIGNPDKPFKTLEALIKKQLTIGNFIDVTFQTTGAYVLPFSIYSGCVIHFRVDDEEMRGNVDLFPPEGHTGGLYFYDSHINVIAKPNCPISLNSSAVIQIEGSVLTTSDRTIFNCTHLNMVQGSVSFTGVTINGALVLYFALARVNTAGLIVNNQMPRIAIDIICGTFRTEGDVLRIIDNATDVSTLPAIHSLSSDITWNPPNATYGGEALSYHRFFDFRATTLRMTDEFLASLNTKCANPAVFTSFGIRTKTTVVLPETI